MYRGYRILWTKGNELIRRETEDKLEKSVYTIESVGHFQAEMVQKETDKKDK